MNNLKIYIFYRMEELREVITLKFLESPDNYQVPQNTPINLQFCETALYGVFDVFVIRKDFPSAPLFFCNRQQPVFSAFGAESVTEVDIEYGGVMHKGFRCTFNRHNILTMKFFQVGTFLTSHEKSTGLRVHTAKKWLLLFASAAHNDIVKLLEFQVVSVIRSRKFVTFQETSSPIQRLPLEVIKFTNLSRCVVSYWPPYMISLINKILEVLNNFYFTSGGARTEHLPAAAAAAVVAAVTNMVPSVGSVSSNI